MDWITAKATGVWMGLRRCGCPVAVACDYGDDAPPKMKATINKSKREFLKDGLSVVYATWDEWVSVHSHKFMRDCEHRAKQPAAVELPLISDAVDPQVTK